MKMVSFDRIIAILLLICNSNCIQPDYYLGNDDDKEQTNVYDTTDSRRLNDEIESKLINMTFISPDEEDDNDIDLFKAIPKITKTKIVHVSTTPIPKTVRKLKILTSREMLRDSDLTVMDSTPFNVFQEYQYPYDESTDTQELKSETPQNATINTTIHELKGEITYTPKDNDITENTDENVTFYKNKSIKYLTDFYNLEPAVVKFHVMIPTQKEISEDGYVWYVAQKYLCWDLPILYGEMGLRNKMTDVFQVFSSRLKNVVDNVTDSEVSKPYVVPESVIQSNKWCSEAPCYGDHTLCLFADSSLSDTCVDEYKVAPPTMMEQIALVNTLNSMRNRIANGASEKYSHLPPAANMQQIIFDYDLEMMAKVWLAQCLPGIAPCSSFESHLVTPLECIKHAEQCCVKSNRNLKQYECTPQYECFITPVIGCLHAWFWSAGQKLSGTDVECGHIVPDTFNTAQLLWAETRKVGCAFGVYPNGDVRVLCNFAPGAPFHLDSKYYCGLIAQKDITKNYPIFAQKQSITDLNFLASIGIKLDSLKSAQSYETNVKNFLRMSDLDVLNKIYNPGWIRNTLKAHKNGTIGMVARLVTRYTFVQEDFGKCDTNDPIYIIGKSGSLCVEKGQRFESLCYDFSDPTHNYRLIAILAPIALFILIIYDLFSSVMRQTNY